MAETYTLMLERPREIAKVFDAATSIVEPFLASDIVKDLSSKHNGSISYRTKKGLVLAVAENWRPNHKLADANKIDVMGRIDMWVDRSDPWPPQLEEIMSVVLTLPAIFDCDALFVRNSSEVLLLRKDAKWFMNSRRAFSEIVGPDAFAERNMKYTKKRWTAEDS